MPEALGLAENQCAVEQDSGTRPATDLGIDAVQPVHGGVESRKPVPTPPSLGSVKFPRASGCSGSGSLRPLLGMLCGASLLLAGNGLFQTLIPLHLLESGGSTLVVGLIQSLYSCGYLLGAVLNRRLIDRIGQHRTFVAHCASVAILAVAFGALKSPWQLAIIRLVTGIVFIGLTSAIESWLNSSVRNDARGRVYGLYMTINFLSMATGQLLLNVSVDDGTQRFALVSVLFAAAIIPVSVLDGWPVQGAVAPLGKVPATPWLDGIRTMTSVAPIAVPAGVVVGAVYSTFYSMMPVFLKKSGFEPAELAAFMSVALVFALLPQWPMGRISDRLDKPRLIYRTTLVVLCLNLLLIGVRDRMFIWAGMLSFVAVAFTQYSLIASHLNDKVEPHQRVTISLTFLVLYSIGGILGPVIASFLMTLIGPSGLFIFNSIAFSLLALLAKKTLRTSEARGRT